ncbi:sarcosine oxidase subunit alpha family protein [Hyphomicrobium sp. CS1BSMeth3]|uniref:sarcosine oxidase subunit alpha family protein n=1 Tax=Hyphomicrobium sp. CS1BSMeth3 TaxID=1892844 RepID=UPI0009300471|nr:sarcosine oxidase subunit alpha family protein [Hyphomicrobium sp. CS1BSMeth3]
MSIAMRLPSGGQIDRARPIRFRFDGRTMSGFAGDTLASALVANGVRLVGRSFKYHRPRGILSAGSEEPNALVELRAGARREPNTRATTVELFDGLEAQSQNRWPSLGFDVLALNGLAGSFLSAGFYYKTFMWPAAFWEKVYEPLIRRAAGLGRSADAEDPDHYEKAHAHCDVLVIGGGPAGLMAALTVARSGARVILADEDFVPGGRLNAERHEIDSAPGSAWAAIAAAELASMSNVRLMRRTTVFGVYDGGTYGAIERVNDHVAVPPPFAPRQRTWRIYARRAILASGALERPLVFANNDRPGIMLGGAVRSYVNRFAATPGQRLAVFTCCDDGWRTAIDAAAAGISIEAVIDSREDASPALGRNLTANGTRILRGAQVMRAFGSRGLQAIEVCEASGRITNISCDVLAVSGGWSPITHLTSHLGGRPAWNEALAAFVPGTLPPGMSVIGAANGMMTLAASLASGRDAGARVLSDLGRNATPAPLPKADDEPAAIRALWHVAGGRGPAFIDFQNDVTAKDVGLANREGYRGVELLKRYTTLGMATDQGKTSNINGLAILASERAQPIASVGTTLNRPPYTPVAIGALAGHHRGKDFRPTRLSPLHAWAKEQGAVFIESGAWLRASWFPRPGEKDWLESAAREVRAVRSAVGLTDVSTLGKIDIQGPDAATLLDRVYCNTFSTLQAGRARYGVMLREDGFVMDDGTTSRLAPDHFIMTTTTANAVGIMRHLEFCHQCLWPNLDVQMASISEQWAQMAIAGPKSRETFARIVDRQHDISDAAFPYLTTREVTILGGTRARLFRISYSGELAYELAVPAGVGSAVATAIMKAGADLGIQPYGLEAMGIMRIEKGHVAGNEINGQTTARDLGLGKMMSKKKDYIGRVLAERPALVMPDRWGLVGLKSLDWTVRIRAGAHLIPIGAAATTANDLGYVTSVAFSPTLERWIGLGLIAGGASKHGTRVRLVDLLRGTDVEAEVCDPIFYDPKGERLHG